MKSISIEIQLPVSYTHLADLYSLFINILHAKGRFSKEYFYNLIKSVMKVEKFKVLLYLKKSEPDKIGKAPIMGRISLNRTMAQFSCKLSCTPCLLYTSRCV